MFKDALAESATRLLEKETLSGDELPILVAQSGRLVPAHRDPRREPVESRPNAPCATEALRNTR